MVALINLSGQPFGFWTVESYAGTKYWWCVCDCGKRSKVHATNLRNGGSRSCGCKNLKLKDISGQRFGRWVAISYDKVQQKWLCRCDCGTERFVVSDNIRSGKTHSCGCSTRALPGTRYGHWTLLKFLGTDTWEAQCDCGKKDTKREACLRIGRVDASCGCVIREKNTEILNQYEATKPKYSSRLKDLTGVRSGMIVALEYAGNGKWTCRCDCGNTKALAVGGLRKGVTRSCGCVGKAKTIARNKAGIKRSGSEDLTGKTFGRWFVVGMGDKNWLCRCACGAQKEVLRINLTRGHSRSCGCLLRDLNSQYRRYASTEERERIRNDRKRQRRHTDPEYAERVRERGRMSLRRSLLTEEGKERAARAFTKRRAACPTGEVSRVQWLRIVDAWNCRCAYCGDAGKLTQDHVIVPACQRCNCRKTNHDLEEALVRLNCRDFHARREAAMLLLKDMNNA